MDTFVTQPSHQKPSAMATARRLPILLLLSIPAAAVVMWDEVLLAGPIVFLTETLGFIQGFLAFTLLWAAIGIGALVTIDYVWPALNRILEPLARKMRSPSAADQGDGSRGWMLHLGITAVGATFVAAVLLALLFGGEIAEWAGDHEGEAGMFIVVTAVVFVILAIVDWLGRGIERWVRRIATTAGPRLRSFAALITMVYLGPVLGWGLFPVLGYTRRATYGLTLLAAPVFAAIWVPFYSFGIWGIVEGQL